MLSKKQSKLQQCMTAGWPKHPSSSIPCVCVSRQGPFSLLSPPGCLTGLPETRSTSRECYRFGCCLMQLSFGRLLLAQRLPRLVATVATVERLRSMVLVLAQHASKRSMQTLSQSACLLGWSKVVVAEISPSTACKTESVCGRSL